MTTPWYRRYAKALVGILATVTPAAAWQILDSFGVHLDPKWTALATLLLVGAGVWRVPNKPPVS